MLCCRSSEVCSTLSSAVKVNSFLVTISNRECRKDLFLKVVLELEKNSILILQATNAQVLKSDVLQLFSIPSCSIFVVSLLPELFCCAIFGTYLREGGCARLKTVLLGAALHIFKQVLPTKLMLQITQHCWAHNTSVATATPTRSTS